MAVGVHVLEGAFPPLLPGVKPGLANVFTVVALCHLGWSAASWVCLLRIFAGSLVLGTFLTPTFILSLSGGLAGILVLRVAWLSVWRRHFGPVGYSLLSSLAHVGAQIVVVYLFFLPHAGLFRLLPILCACALFFGLLNGILSQKLLAGLNDSR